jgi:hypothetical protein
MQQYPLRAVWARVPQPKRQARGHRPALVRGRCSCKAGPHGVCRSGVLHVASRCAAVYCAWPGSCVHMGVTVLSVD